MIREMKNWKVFTAFPITILLASCQPLPSDCVSLYTSLQRKSYESAHENNYYISELEAFSNPHCYGQTISGLKNKEFISCSYSIKILPDGSLKTVLHTIECKRIDGCKSSNEHPISGPIPDNKLWDVYVAKNPDEGSSYKTRSNYLNSVITGTYYNWDDGKDFDMVHYVDGNKDNLSLVISSGRQIKDWFWIMENQYNAKHMPLLVLVRVMILF